MAKRRSTKSQRNKKPNGDKNLRGETTTSVNAGLGRVALLFVVGVMLGALLTYAATRPDGTRSTSSHVARAASLDQSSHSGHASRPLTLGDLLTLTPEKLKKIDPVEANLLCAQGLPGAEAIDIPKAQGISGTQLQNTFLEQAFVPFFAMTRPKNGFNVSSFR